MTILGIETSCDETAVSIVRAEGRISAPRFDVLSNLVLSQIKTHEKYGGVFPAMAKREHILNIIPLLEKAFEEVKIGRNNSENGEDQPFKISPENKEVARKILEHETGLYEKMIEFVQNFDGKNGQVGRPKIDAIAVTYGPGLEPALWVGLNAARALGKLLNIPVIPINHMEGHICSILLDTKKEVRFPAIALLISGGHTELIVIKNWTDYKIIGETKDDAVGEAFDKVARMLGLSYPGGPEISRLAEELRKSRSENILAEIDKKPAQVVEKNPFVFPRPMIHSHDLNFSFSGLKTSVLYAIRKLQGKSPTEKAGPKKAGVEKTRVKENELDFKTKSQIAEAFEDAVTDVLVVKTMEAVEAFNAQSLIIAGGVVANKNISHTFEKIIKEKNQSTDENFGNTGGNIELLIPRISLSGDNALMIALCAYVRILHGKTETKLGEEVRAIGNARLSK